MIHYNSDRDGESHLLFKFMKERTPLSDNRKIVELIPDSLIGFCDKGIINFWNTPAEKLFGWNQKEILGKSISQLITSPNILAFHKGRIKEDRIFDLTGIHKSGHRIPIEMTIKIASHKKKPYFFTFVRNSEMKQKINSEYNSLYTHNTILKRLLTIVTNKPKPEAIISLFLEEIAQFKNCELAFACQKINDQLVRIEPTTNNTSLIFSDFSKQVDHELIEMNKKERSFAPGAEAIHDIQSNWNNPFYIFGKNFGFHGCLTLTLESQNTQPLLLFFLSTHTIDLSSVETQFLNECLETMKKYLKPVNENPILPISDTDFI